MICTEAADYANPIEPSGHGGQKIAQAIARCLDAVDGTPVLDVKPFMVEFAPRGPVFQPEWASDLMRTYW